MIIELNNICKVFGEGELGFHALKNVCFQMEKGEYVAIMGPSGSGKSTLLNIVGCLDRPTSGTYILDGENVAECSDNRMADIRLAKMGFIFQTFQLLPQKSALENVALPLLYANVPAKERRSRAEEALKAVGLGDRLDHIPSKLSGGQRQRVAIARALINNPAVLLADEPTGALDSASGMQIMEIFDELNRSGVTILMITHDAKVAARAGKVMTIHDGILSDGMDSKGGNPFE
jgi:putative ABC transport system ATP-binding protein